jgi:ribonuclease PH
MNHPAFDLAHFVAAISISVYQCAPVLDLHCTEAPGCATDTNVVIADASHFIEV